MSAPGTLTSVKLTTRGATIRKENDWTSANWAVWREGMNDAALLAAGSVPVATPEPGRPVQVASVPLDEIEWSEDLLEAFGAKVRTQGYPSGEYHSTMYWPDGREAHERDRIAIISTDSELYDDVPAGYHVVDDPDRGEMLVPNPVATPEPDSGITNQAGHEFTFTVEMRGEGFNWSSTMVPQTVRAYDLPAAISELAKVPLVQWFPDESDEVATPQAEAAEHLTHSLRGEISQVRRG